jgi:competence protein ComEC
MIGLVLGILPIPLLPGLPPRELILVPAATGLLALSLRHRFFRLFSGLSIGLALALAAGHALLAARLPEECVRSPVVASGQVSSLPRSSLLADGAVRQRFEFTVATLDPVRCRGPRRLLLSYYGSSTLVPGEHWRFELSLKRPRGLANPGSFNMAAWFAQSRIDAVGSVRKGGATRLAAARGVNGLHHRLRAAISQRIALLPFDPQVIAMLRALTVADRSGIDSRLWLLLQQYGVNHLLVISGLHVGLVAAAGYLLGALVLRLLLLLAGRGTPQLPALAALLCGAGYTALAGFSLSTQRALAMLACVILASLCGRSSGSANNLLLAAVVVLVINPLAVLGSGLWLSFGAVAALLWLAPWLAGKPRWQRLPGTHAYMMLVMLPMGGWWFGGSSLVAGLANFLMVPLVGLVVVPLALLAVLTGYLAPGPDQWLWECAAWPLEQLLPPARQLAASGLDWLYLPLVPGLPEVVLAGLGVALLILPAPVPLRILALLLAVPLLSPPDPARAASHGDTRLTVLDVGQGTAVVVRAGGRALLYDTGGGDPAGVNMATAVVLPYLRQQGIKELDTLIISHPDADHSAGVGSVLHSLPVARFFVGGALPGVTSGQPCVAGRAWRWPGGQTFQLLSPADETGLSSNDSSCVLQIEAAGHRLLLAGDIERSREHALVRYWAGQLRSDWLLVAHHGSQTSSSWAWLKTVQAHSAVISSAYASRFGHPHPAVMDRLRQSGARIYDTASGGALEFELALGQPITVRRYRQRVRRFWM